MAVRRLAEEEFQPQGFAFDAVKSAEARKWIAKYPEGRQASAVIPLLMLAQEQEGWVTRAAIEEVSRILDMPKIRVLEVATFYTQFQLQPVGSRAHVQVCGTTPCMLRGAEELKDVCRHRIHHEQFARNEAGTLSWEEVECLGACVNAPMVMIGKDTYEDLTPQRLSEIIEAFEAGRGDTITPGPQVERHYSAPAGGLTSLTNGGDGGSAPRPTSPAEGEALPPSKAARPSTHADESDASLASAPSPKKTSPKSEEATSNDPGTVPENTTAGKGPARKTPVRRRTPMKKPE